MNGEDIKTCPYHEDLKDQVKSHDIMIHRLDKGLVQLKATIWTIGSPLVIGTIVLVLRAFGAI